MSDPSLQNIDPGITFTELFPGTYYAIYEKYDKDAKYNAIQAQYFLNKCKEFTAKQPKGDFNLIIDTSKIDSNVFFLSSEAKKAYLDAVTLPGSGKIALVGFGKWLRKFITFLLPFSKHLSETAFFDTREEAIEWIK